MQGTVQTPNQPPACTPRLWIFSKLFYFCSGKWHSSSLTVQTDTASSQLLKKIYGTAGRDLYFLPTVVHLREECKPSPRDKPGSQFPPFLTPGDARKAEQAEEQEALYLQGGCLKSWRRGYWKGKVFHLHSLLRVLCYLVSLLSNFIRKQ